MYGPVPKPADSRIKLKQPVSGIFQYLQSEGPLRAGLADDARDLKRAGVDIGDDSQRFNRYGKLASSNGVVVKDAWSRGVRPDVAAHRDFPYQCGTCDSSFLTALQLSDHLLSAHGERIHASLLKPKTAERISKMLPAAGEDNANAKRDSDDDNDPEATKKQRGWGTSFYNDFDD